VTVVQASIRRLFEDVRALEAEVATRPRRRRTRDRALVVAAAAVIGAACAGTQHAVRAAAPAAPVHALRAVAHLIDAPAERTRALPATVRQHAAVHTPARPLEPRSEAARHDRVDDESSPSARGRSFPGSRVTVAPATRRAVVTHVVHVALVRPVATTHVVAPVQHTAPAHPRVSAAPAPVPVGIGPVVVATADEPVPDPDAGVSPAPAP
jgi:hypothetical protein